MIKSKNELKFYLSADRMMNRGKFKRTFRDIIKEIFVPDYIMKYLIALRHVSYYKSRGGIYTLLAMYYTIKMNRLGTRLGFSIGSNVFGYGLVIPHYGTIVVGGSNLIGNYAVLHTSTCISDNGKIIGDGLYLSTGAKITSQIQLGNNISVGANSVVNKSFLQDNLMIAGAPAKVIKEMDAWYMRDGEKIQKRVELVENLRMQLEL